MGKLLSAEALLANPNTKPVMGSVEFLELTPPGGKGKKGKMFQVVCEIKEEPVPVTGAMPRKPQTITDEFGHLKTNRQRQGRSSGEIADLSVQAWLGK